MDDFLEFQGKNLDSVITEACKHFDTERGKLEIEILEDSKSGIFGIVGARKARIRARLASSEPLKADTKSKPLRGKQMPQKQTNQNKPYKKDTPSSPDYDEDESQSQFFSKIDKHVESLELNTVIQEDLDEYALEKLDREAAARVQTLGNDTESEIRAKKQMQRSSPTKNTKPRAPHNPRARQSPAPSSIESVPYEHKRLPKPVRPVREETEERTPLPRIPLAELDQEKLISLGKDVLHELLKSIVDDDTVIEVQVENDQLKIKIESQDTGLLIGREGQNLAAIQYLATRIIARKMESQIRLHVDTGDYHSRQDARIQETALFLAERVRTLGRSQSTRPMTAYQRRIVHLTLQDVPDIYTRSSGDDTLKRVIILPKKVDHSTLAQHTDTPVEDVQISDTSEFTDVIMETTEDMPVEPSDSAGATEEN